MARSQAILERALISFGGSLPIGRRYRGKASARQKESGGMRRRALVGVVAVWFDRFYNLFVVCFAVVKRCKCEGGIEEMVEEPLLQKEKSTNAVSHAPRPRIYASRSVKEPKDERGCGKVVAVFPCSGSCTWLSGSRFECGCLRVVRCRTLSCDKQGAPSVGGSFALLPREPERGLRTHVSTAPA